MKQGSRLRILTSVWGIPDVIFTTFFSDALQKIFKNQETAILNQNLRTG